MRGASTGRAVPNPTRPPEQQSRKARHVYAILSATGRVESRDLLPCPVDADLRTGTGDFIKDDLMAAAMDLLAAARLASHLAEPQALAEPAARVMRVRAVLEELSEHLSP